MSAEVRSRQVDGGLEVFKALRVGNCGGKRVPLELVGCGRRVAYELENKRVARSQGVPERSSEQP